MLVQLTAVANHWANSDTASSVPLRALRILATPTFSYPGGTWRGSDSVQVRCIY
jgi:hypothetical protein